MIVAWGSFLKKNWLESATVLARNPNVAMIVQNSLLTVTVVERWLNKKIFVDEPFLFPTAQ